jgi:hypothetical protein
METQNPAETPPVRVRYGPGQDDSVPLSWAETMLTKLHTDNPAWFGKLIMAATRSGR